MRTLSLSFAYMQLSLKTISREPAALFFIGLFPIMFLLIFSSILTFEIELPGGTPAGIEAITFSQYFVAGITASAVFGTSFNLFGNALAVQQFDGTLKQLAATPLPRISFFLGMAGSSTVITLGQVVVLLIIGTAAYDLSLPDAGGWLTLIWIILLGVPAGCVMGLAMTPLIPSARAAPAILQVPFILLQFTSGVFFPLYDVPAALQWISGLFPLRWVAQGLRSVFLPDVYQNAEPGMSWNLEIALLVMLVWILLGLLIARFSFRWDRSG